MRLVKRIAEPYKTSVNQHPPVGTMVKIPFNPVKYPVLFPSTTTSLQLVSQLKLI
jgi:hypothetical protein